MSKKILFVYRHFSSFVKKDFEILNKNHSVTKLHATKNLPLLIFKFLILVPRNDVVFVWFADWHSFIATLFTKLFRKKIIVVVGGYETSPHIPKINYGISSKFRRKIIKWVLKNADFVLAVSKFTEKEILKQTKPKELRVVYNGVDIEKFKPKGKKENLVLSVLKGDYLKKAKLKGLDTFLNAAKLFPKIKFLIIGLSKQSLEYLKETKPNNVKIIGPLKQKEILKYYQKTKVYCQLSYRESFGMALAEGMACGCIPVITKRTALAEVVGNTGFYVPYGNVRATAEAIKKALKSIRGKTARERIKNKFSLKKRKKKIIEIMEGLDKS